MYRKLMIVLMGLAGLGLAVGLVGCPKPETPATGPSPQEMERIRAEPVTEETPEAEEVVETEDTAETEVPTENNNEADKTTQ